jgi:hypothetical protein
MKHTSDVRRWGIAALLAVGTLAAGDARADDKAAGGGDLRAAVQNPISSLVSLPFKFTLDYGASNGEASILNIQPVYPVAVGDWNLVSRLIAPLAHVDGPINGLPGNPSPVRGNGATGLGDFNYSLFFSPAEYDKVIWGVGPSISLPTATSDQLGAGKWTAGPTAVALMQPGWGSLGILGRHLWSFAGDPGRRNVSQSLIEPFANYNQLGNQAINSRLEGYYNVRRPDGAPYWQLSFTWQFLFPK